MQAVQTALSLHNPKPCSWLEGFTDADQLFVAPPVNGWILIIGRGLPTPTSDVDACFRFVLELSRRVGEVQFFYADHSSYHHAWVKADSGRILRAYAWADGPRWQQGRITSAEKRLGLRSLGYADSMDPNGQLELAQGNVLKVPLLAQSWGLDPWGIPQHFPREELGVAGTPARRF